MSRIPLSPQKNIQNTSRTPSHGTRDHTVTSAPISSNNVSQVSTSDELPTVWQEALDSPFFPTICKVLAAAARGEISLETRTRTQTIPPKQGPATSVPASTESQPPADDVEKTTRIYRRVSDKLDIIGEALKEVDWSLGDFLHYLSEENLKTRGGKDVPRSESSSRYLSEFLLGRNTYHAIDIVEAWFKHSYGRPKDEEREMMYSTDVPASDIKGARAAISSFAVQLVEKQLVREMENVIKPSSGLHVTAQSKTGKHALDWERLGPELFDDVAAILQEHQPLAWHLLIQMASRRPRLHEGEAQSREHRPVEPIITDVLSRIAYSRSNRAKLLPMAHGIHHFASGAHSSLYRINSRLATTPAYSTIRGALVDMAKKEAAHVRELGKCEKTWFRLCTDNVQRFSKRWEPSMSKQSHMLKGMAATAIKVDGVDPKAWDLDDKLARLAKNERLDVTAHWFLSQVDNRHLEDVKVLQWVQTLVRYVPALSKHRKHINILYHTRVAKTAPETITKTEVYPLTPTEKDEGITAELKDAFVEFLEQIGQTEDDYLRRIILAGGDGLTYEKLLQIKKYLQFHKDDFQSLAIVEALLELWHTQWTELCRIFQTHWHQDMSKDPSSLGHSASKIGWKPPSNLAKVNYYPGTRMAYTVLDARLLDCWRIYFGVDDLFTHFEALESTGTLPSFEELEHAAVNLCRSYTCTRAFERALRGEGRSGEYAVPEGSHWTPRNESHANADNTTAKKGSNRAAQAHTRGGSSKRGRKAISKHSESQAQPVPFTGDRVLAQSCRLMEDLMISREAAYAVAVGDAGRVYECVKLWLFTFAGSNHNKYTTYLMELIVSLELESSPSLRAAIFRTWLVNPSGRPGHFLEADLLQEHFNKALEELVQRKDIGFDDNFLTTVAARNMHHLQELPKAMEEGLGLKHRSDEHSSPANRPEIVTLLRVYREVELHYWRRGRTYGERDVDDHTRGLNTLLAGRVDKWKTETTADRGLTAQASHTSVSQDELPHGDISDDEEDGEERPLTRGRKYVVDGELCIDIDDVAASASDVVSG